VVMPGNVPGGLVVGSLIMAATHALTRRAIYAAVGLKPLLQPNMSLWEDHGRDITLTTAMFLVGGPIFDVNFVLASWITAPVVRSPFAFLSYPTAVVSFHGLNVAAFTGIGYMSEPLIAKLYGVEVPERTFTERVVHGAFFELMMLPFMRHAHAEILARAQELAGPRRAQVQKDEIIAVRLVEYKQIKAAVNEEIKLLTYTPTKPAGGAKPAAPAAPGGPRAPVDAKAALEFLKKIDEGEGFFDFFEAVEPLETTAARQDQVATISKRLKDEVFANGSLDPDLKSAMLERIAVIDSFHDHPELLAQYLRIRTAVKTVMNDGLVNLYDKVNKLVDFPDGQPVTAFEPLTPAQKAAINKRLVDTMLERGQFSATDPRDLPVIARLESELADLTNASRTLFENPTRTAYDSRLKAALEQRSELESANPY